MRSGISVTDSGFVPSPAFSDAIFFLIQYRPPESLSFYLLREGKSEWRRASSPDKSMTELGRSSNFFEHQKKVCKDRDHLSGREAAAKFGPQYLSNPRRCSWEDCH